MYDNKRKLLNFIQVSVDLRKGGWGGMGVVDLVTNTVCIERAVCFIGVWEHSVMCWFYPQKGIKKMILLQHIFGMTHTHKSQRTSVTHRRLFHTLTWPGRDCDCLMVSLHLNTALDDSEWCTQITASLVIYLFVFLLCLSFFFFFQVHVYGTWEKRSSSHKHKHPF